MHTNITHPHNWHSATMKRFSRLCIDSLEYIKLDAYQAAQAGEKLGNPKTGQYWDEYHYACMELAKRKKKAK